MDDRETKLAQAWIKKAENDLVTARQTLLLADGPTDTVCFHAQQAAEKALKALLTHRHVAVPKSHSLLALLDLVLSFAPDLEDFREHFAAMSTQAVEVRYPVIGSTQPEMKHCSPWQSPRAF